MASPAETTRDPNQRTLPIAFIAVIGLFVLSTSFAEFTARNIDTSAASIARNAAPSIQHLEAARTELRHLELLVEHYLDARDAGAPPNRAALEGSWQQVQNELEAYNRIPYFAGEQPLIVSLDHQLLVLQDALSRLALDDDAGQLRAARQVQSAQFEPALLQLLDASVRLVEFNSQQAEALALRIEHSRDRSSWFAFALDAVSGVMALLIGYLAFREVRRTTQLLAERNRLAERRADELEQFSGRVAHDVLGPLMAVGLAMELSQKLPPDSDKRDEVLGRGKAALQRVKLIVDGLLEFARSGATPDADAQAELEEVVEGLFSELRPQTDSLQIELRSDGPLRQRLACSPGVLTSALSNLVRNAIKYMGDRDERRITVRAVPLEGRVRIEVEDTGPGLLPALGPHLFEPYVRGKGHTQPGIGLGLATVKRIATAHGGTVGVRSSPGQGATFWLELPLYARPSAEGSPRLIA